MFVSKLWKPVVRMSEQGGGGCCWVTCRKLGLRWASSFMCDLLCDSDFLSEYLLINWMWSTILGVPEPVFTMKKIVLNYEKTFFLLWAKAVGKGIIPVHKELLAPIAVVCEPVFALERRWWSVHQRKDFLASRTPSLSSLWLWLTQISLRSS